MCRDSQHLEIVDIVKFFSLGGCRTSHPCKFAIELEEVLVGDSCDSFGFFLDGDGLFCFDSLMESLTKSPAWHRTTSVFIDDEYFIIFDHIFFAIVIAGTSFEGILDMVDLVETEVFVEILDIEHLL